MSETPQLGAFCYEDSLIINPLRRANAKQAARIAELETQNTRLLAENSRLREGARYALGGWRENDWPEGFDRGTAEYIADGYRAAIAEDTE